VVVTRYGLKFMAVAGHYRGEFAMAMRFRPGKAGVEEIAPRVAEGEAQRA